MAKWNGSNEAPKGQYRVIGTDTFSWTHEDYWLGDYADLLQAKDLANSKAQAMNPVAVYGEDGKLLYFVGPEDAEK